MPREGSTKVLRWRLPVSARGATAPPSCAVPQSEAEELDVARVGRAVVIGAGFVGLLAAQVLARHVERVLLVDQDQLPAGPTPRRGTPQARHSHLLWSGGARAVERIVPGALTRLQTRGANRIALPAQLLSMSSAGWMRRFAGEQYLLACSRDLLDWTLREEILLDGAIEVSWGCQATSLVGDQHQVRGIRLYEAQHRREIEVSCDLLVIATGRASRAEDWLVGLGLPAPPTKIIHPGVFYVTHAFQAPRSMRDGFPLVSIHPSPNQPTLVRAGSLVPIEEGLWHVTLSVIRGTRPPARSQDFIALARQARTPFLADLISLAQPIGSVRVTRATSNYRKYVELLPAWPQGLLLIGDALTAYNPFYGHGMSAGARGVLELDGALSDGGHEFNSRAVQRSVVETTRVPWAIASRQDREFAEHSSRPSLTHRTTMSFLRRLLATANEDPMVAEAMLDVYTLSKSHLRLLSPQIIARILIGSRVPPLDHPPLTQAFYC
ncbi:FAD-dependent oxidoreductase [Micromonospora sp. CA-244673]|uniref:FAD-dependent oxidoreductase n=1 Tax=Micromonospora sp. CA-244673 TaxID=3239958 RepID=UPI003D8B1985